MKQSTYLETSVIGAYLDNGEPFRRDLTIRWWEHELSEYRAVISPLVTANLSVCLSRIVRLSEFDSNLEQVELTEEQRSLPKVISRAAFFIVSTWRTRCM